MFYDIRGDMLVTDERSFSNRTEALFIIEMLKALAIQMDLATVAIITPYRGQVSPIKELITEANLPSRPVVATIDSFQGREMAAVIFSCVRSSQQPGLGFMKDARRMNVALTRAKQLLSVVGNLRVLAHDRTWHNLIEDARHRGLIRTSLDEAPLLLPQGATGNNPPPTGSGHGRRARRDDRRGQTPRRSSRSLSPARSRRPDRSRPRSRSRSRTRHQNSSCDRTPYRHGTRSRDAAAADLTGVDLRAAGQPPDPRRRPAGDDSRGGHIRP